MKEITRKSIKVYQKNKEDCPFISWLESFNLNKKICTSGKNKKHSKAAKEPWLLVTSLPQARDNPNHIVNIYRQRMRIEAHGGITKLSEKTSKGRNSLYKTISSTGNPYLRNTNEILHTSGFHLSVTPNVF